MVFCDLKDKKDIRLFIEDCNQSLLKIPGIVSWWCGVHGDFGRKSVESSYDVGLYVGFNTGSDYENYLVDKRHVGFVTRWK